MEEWKECKLGEYLYIKGRIGWKGLKKDEYLNKSPYRIINGESLTEKGIEWSKAGFITKERYDESPEIMLEINDILLSKDGTIGKIGFVKELLSPTTVASGIFVIRNIKPEIIDTMFIYHFLRSSKFKNFIKMRTEGSVIPHLYQKDFEELNFPLPPLPTQQKIAAILSSLDDKIELNNKINTNLEQQAQALFKNWFVDFEPFGGKMPEGWKVGKLSDVAEIKTNTFKPEQNPDIQVEHYSLPAFDEKQYPTFEISKELKSNKFIISNDEVLVSKLNPTVKRVWRPYCLTEKSICSTEFIVYKPISAELKDYLFSIVNSSEFNDFMCSNVTGSTNSHQRTPPKTTLNYEIPIPTKDILHKFCNIVTPMYDKIKENIKQNETVSSLRDTLLPKLMNGEIVI